jgi:hypothetical protein
LAVGLEQFVRNLIQSGLFTADELAAFQERLLPDKRPKDPQGLARELIRAGKLTKYQAGLVCQGKTKGLVLGEYVILDQIGRGGMGQVFKARHRTMERVVALKILPQEAMRSPRAVERFHREVKAAAKLSHPNIVTDASKRGHVRFPPDYRLMPTSPCVGKASDRGDVGCRYTPEMVEMLKLAFALRAQGIIKF